MKVYLVYDYPQVEGYDELCVDKIFDSLDKAQLHAIKLHYSLSYYKDMKREWLNDNVSRYIDEMDVE